MYKHATASVLHTLSSVLCIHEASMILLRSTNVLLLLYYRYYYQFWEDPKLIECNFTIVAIWYCIHYCQFQAHSYHWPNATLLLNYNTSVLVQLSSAALSTHSRAAITLDWHDHYFWRRPTGSQPLSFLSLHISLLVKPPAIAEAELDFCPTHHWPVLFAKESTSDN